MRILLIDDHALFRIGLQELLERRGIEVIAAIGDCEAGIMQVIDSQPDIVLLDMRMPQMSGIEVLQQLRDRQQKMAISMLTTSRDEKDIIESLQGGAQGYLLKDMEPDDLITALNDILKGKTVVAPELTSVLARAVKGETAESTETNDVFSGLTPRESEILCHLAEGQSNKVIANHLGISDGTVKLHVKSILRKLDVNSRVEAAVIAVEKKMCQR
ncbi:MAG: response regulator transcription factor [Gammaproteobacteria bacterium]|nr:response regulator transcription factor [Gammaproteobacteria bacterium]